MYQKSNLDIAKERIVQLYGTESCKKLVNMPFSEEAFSVLKRRIESEFSKYNQKKSIGNSLKKSLKLSKNTK